MFQNIADRNTRSNPDAAEILRRSFVGDILRPLTTNSSEWPLQSTNDICDRDRLGSAVKPVSTIDSALAGHDAVVTQIPQNRFEELHRDALGLREVVAFDERARIGLRRNGQLEQRTHCVVDFGGHVHGYIQSGGVVHG